MFSPGQEVNSNERFEAPWHAPDPRWQEALTRGELPNGDAPGQALTRAHSVGSADAGFSAYLRQVRVRPRLDAAQERELFAQLAHGTSQAGHDAQNTLVQAHLWLVPVVVRRFHRQGGFEDLVAEGNLGLFRALARFDPARGLRFSSYAKWWVIHAVTASMAANAHPVRLPSRIAQRLSKAQSTGGMAFLPQGSEPAYAPPAPPEPALSAGPFFLPEVAFSEAAHEAHADNADSQPEAVLALKQDALRLTHAMNTLSPRERTVVQARYGLAGCEPRTLQDIALQLGLSAEGVRKTQVAAMGKLRNLLAQ
jgi:RNA polymerase sigma factor (sigma-70 family)